MEGFYFEEMNWVGASMRKKSSGRGLNAVESADEAF
jgi:hypothetical protein